MIRVVNGTVVAQTYLINLKALIGRKLVSVCFLINSTKTVMIPLKMIVL